MTREFQLVEDSDAVVPEEPADDQNGSRIDPEAPDADALEQAIPIDPVEAAELDAELPLEANAADAMEQRHVVPGGDEYE